MSTVSRDDEAADAMGESVPKPRMRRMAGYTPLRAAKNQNNHNGTAATSGSGAQAASEYVQPQSVTRGPNQLGSSEPRATMQGHSAEPPKPNRRRMARGAAAPQPPEAHDGTRPNNNVGQSTPQDSMGPQMPDTVAAAGGRRRMNSAPVEPAEQLPSTSADAQVSDEKPEMQPTRRQRMGYVPEASATEPGRNRSSDVTSQPISSAPRPSAEASQPKSDTEQEPLHPSGKMQRAWKRPLMVLIAIVAIAACMVFGARWLRSMQGVQDFLLTYDGHSTHLQDSPAGTPWWMGWQHFFNMFFMVLIVRTGLQIRAERRPPGYWTANRDSFFSPRGNTPSKISITQWLHQFLDVFWVANGVLFIVLLFVTGHWKRIVPTNWDIFPNMLSAAIQYASLNWPTENGWIHYNALQLMAYFITVFIAAPLAVVSGLRFSTWWPNRYERLAKSYPVEWARAVHIPVMIYFVAFTIVHVFLVFFTGALRNLNHMYTSRDAADWWGLAIFMGTVLLIAAGWFLARPLFVTPIASALGKVSR